MNKQFFTVLLSMIGMVAFADVHVPMVIKGQMKNKGYLKSDTIHLKVGGTLDNNSSSATLDIKKGGIILYTDYNADGLLFNTGNVVVGTGTGTGSDAAASAFKVRKEFPLALGSGYKHAFSPPFPVNVRDIYDPDKQKTISESSGKYDGVYIQYYDSQERANATNGYGEPWKYVMNYTEVLAANRGYAVWTRGTTDKAHTRLDFPANNIDSVAKAFQYAAKTVPVTDYRRVSYDDKYDLTSRNRGWNYIGGYLASPFATGNQGVNLSFPSGDYVSWSGAIYCQNKGNLSTTGWDNIALFDPDMNDAILSPYMAFFVQIEKGDGANHDLETALTFQQAGLTAAGQVSGHQLRADNTTTSKSFIRLNLSDQNTTAIDKSYILMEDQYRDDYQVGEDAIKMFNSNTPQLWSKLGEEDLFINALYAGGEKEVPLGMSVPATGEYTFSLNDASNLVRSAILLDKTDERVIDVLNENYSFYAQDPADVTDRFTLFLNTTPTTIDQVKIKSVIAYADHSVLTVKNIHPGDFVQVADITGRIISSGIASETAIYTTHVSEKGVYLVTVKGKQNAVLKVLNR
ncbi:MAG: hypothetical protein EZS26_000169 [Candidatus Ordinivivax streblomastigis]|uniref:T9SS C-terminal target domain-containing protein n=1 Tax=Candidatus Ordinivivax streblomastigis TaxID=2540710 RepID=A0A5M8P5F7_9BACT|nr:MAG: hypothetical protein EZS26_000169 [Candidatus Ordinivivax streblomastigis]